MAGIASEPETFCISVKEVVMVDTSEATLVANGIETGVEVEGVVAVSGSGIVVVVGTGRVFGITCCCCCCCCCGVCIVDCGCDCDCDGDGPIYGFGGVFLVKTFNNARAVKVTSCWPPL